MNIGIIENDSLFRNEMVERLGRLPVTGSVRSWKSAEEFLHAPDRPDTGILFIDIGLPGMSGIDLAGILYLEDTDVKSRDGHGGPLSGLEDTEVRSGGHISRDEKPGLARVIVTTIGTDEMIFQALRHGCVGYLLKSEIGNIEAVVDTIAAGGGVMSPTIAVMVMESFQSRKGLPELALLSDREKQVLNLLAEGHKVTRIADIMQISLHTVRQHIKSIYSKLHINNRQALMKKAHDLGIY